MNKKLFVVVVLIVAGALLTTCESAGSGRGSTPCTLVDANGWVGQFFSLTTSDPVSDSGNYYYDMYCADVSAGTWYELGLFSEDNYWLGLSVWDEGEIELIYTDARDFASIYSDEAGRGYFSVWIHKDDLAGGMADYQIYLLPD